MPTTPTSAIDPTAPAPARALELLQDELLALQPDSLASVNLDVAAAALMVIGALPEIRSHRDALVALVGEQMASSVDRLELVARAAFEAAAAHRLGDPSVEVPKLAKELDRMRTVLLAEVRALMAREVVPATALHELKGPHGYKNQCLDVMQLVSILRDDWQVVAPETGLKLTYLDRAEATANALAMAVGGRAQAERARSVDLRQRAFTLLSTTYDDVRRLISFLRWKQGDADEIAPSFFQGLSHKRRRGATTAAPVTES